MRIIVAGGSAAGLLTTLLLARAGHDVTVLDRDPIEPHGDVEEAAGAAFRAAAPHIVQPHGILPLCRELLRERLPDVLAATIAAGVAEATLPSQMPPTLVDRSPRPGDERFTVLQTRRSTFDWVLRRAVANEPGVSMRSGEQVLALRSAGGTPPRVTGVVTTRGELGADLVVDATGRRTPIDRWLEQIGARSTAVEHAECGLAYYSRHYRIRDGVDLPGPPTTRVVPQLDEFTCGIWGGDNGTMQLAVAPLVEDKRFRAVANADVHEAVLRSVPLLDAWLDVLDPISDIFPMGGLHNSLRRLVVDGAPRVIGLVAVGDSVCTTNPTLGRGLSLAMRGAADLADEVHAHGDDLTAVAVAVDDAVSVHVAPFYADQAAIDSARLAALRQRIFGIPAPRPTHDPDRVTFAQLRNAAAYGAESLRAFWKVMGLIESPEVVYRDPAVVAETRAVLAEHGDAPSIAQPTTEQLEAALGVTSGASAIAR